MRLNNNSWTDQKPLNWMVSKCLTRSTFYQAEAAYAKDGIAGLLPRQRGPKGAHKLDATVMAFIEACLDQQGPMSARQLAPLIAAEFGLRVHPRSIERARLRKKKSSGR